MLLNTPTITIERVNHNGNIFIKGDNGDKRVYIGYTEREALKIYRNLYSLQNKKLNIIKI